MLIRETRTSQVRILVLLLVAVILTAPTRGEESDQQKDGAFLANLDQLLTRGEAQQVVDLAIEALRAQTVHPRNQWRVQERLAVALVDLDRAPEAVSIIEDALAENPDEPSLHLYLARALRQMGQKGRAVAEFRQAVDMNPSQYQWRLEYAEMLLALNIRRDALTQIRLARRECGDCDEALRGEVNFHLTVGNSAAALEPLQVLNSRGSDRDIQSLLIQALWAAGDSEAVVTMIDTLGVESLNGAEVLILAQAERMLGKAVQSRVWAQGGQEVLPGQWAAPATFWAIVSETCLLDEDLDQALMAIDRAIALEPGRAVFHHNRAAILVALGRQEEARQALAESERIAASAKGE